MRRGPARPGPARRSTVFAPPSLLDGWPGPAARLVLSGGVVGSFLGLALGLLGLNRPLLNGLVLYLVGFLVGALFGGLIALVLRAVEGRRGRG